MARIRKMEFVGQLADSAVGEKQVVLQGFQQPLFQQVVGGNAELGHHCIVQGNAADVHHLGIFGNPLHVVDMPFEQVLELIGVMVLGYVDRQAVGRSIFTVDDQQKIIQDGHYQIVAICRGMEQFLLDFSQEPHVFVEGFLGN